MEQGTNLTNALVNLFADRWIDPLECFADDAICFGDDSSRSADSSQAVDRKPISSDSVLSWKIFVEMMRVPKLEQVQVAVSYQ